MDNTFSPAPEVPVIQGETLMSFSEAIMEVVAGKKITRESWNNTDYGFLREDGELAFHRNGETFQTWRVVKADIIATDWKVLNA